MFQLQDVSKVYARRGHDVVALQAPALEIRTGDYVAIVGPSGSGKTTLLSNLGGMLSPNAGRVSVGGCVSLSTFSPPKRAVFRRERMGFVFQTFNLVPYLTAVENVQIPLYLNGVVKSEQQRRAAELLPAQVGLKDRLDRPASPTN